MKKIRYGIILLFSMILFSVPVLAAQTYYLPSKIVGDDYSISYSYNKHGHLVKDILLYDQGLRIESKWKYKYDKNGKRVSGERYRVENGKDRLTNELTFDKNQYLKTSNNLGYPEGYLQTYTWNKEGYLVKRSGGTSNVYYSDSRLKEKGFDVKKRSFYLEGKLGTVSTFNKDGLLLKSVSNPEILPTVTTYEYIYNKNGLVKTIITTTVRTDTGKITVDKLNIFYSKTKTDKKTYAEMLNGHDNCFSNALL